MLCRVESRSISPVFVGRAEESSTLLAALARAAAGEPQVLVVGGEAGVGKTRLLEEFLAAACEQQATVAVGGCLELGAEGLPFAPFATALRSLHRKLGDEMAEAAAGREAELARLLPELGSAGRDVHDQEGRTRLFELTVRLLERLAASRTIVLALEDLHWADRSTRELLGYLVRAIPAARLVVLATYRSDDVHRRHPLRPFLAELDRLRSVRRIELPRLSEDEVRAQLAGIRGDAEPDRALVQGIFERSEGNPFFVEELALSGGDSRLSESLRDLLLVRIEELPETAQKVVRVAARNTTVEHALLAAVSGLDDDDLISGLRAAVGANVLVPAAPDEDNDGYRFRHALLREAVIDDLLPGERTRLSRRYAEALEADPTLVRPEERATRLASYWYYARDAAKALPAVMEAIEETRERHAYAEQLKLLERAMELWDDVSEALRLRMPHMGSLESYRPCGCDPADPTNSTKFIDLFTEAAVAARLDGMREQALSYVKKALKQIDPARDPRRAAWFWMERSRLVTESGRGDGWAELAEALKLVEDQPPSAVQADVLSNVANWLVLHRWDESTVELSERAVAVAREVGALEVELNARVSLACIQAERNEEDGWLADLLDAREQAGRIGAPRLLQRVHAAISDQLEKYGRSAEAVEAGLVGVEELSRRGLYDSAAFIAGNVAESMTTMGDWDRADAVIAKWRRHARGARPRASMEKQAATLALARGRHEESRGPIAAARSLMGKNDGEPQFGLPLYFTEIECAAARGEHAEAMDRLRGGLELLPLPGQASYVAQFLLAGAGFLAETAGLPGLDEAEHAELLDRVEAEAGRITQQRVRRPAMVLHISAELARARGADDPSHWERAAAELEPYEIPYQLAKVQYRWAGALLAAGGDRERAAELLTAAHAATQRLGAEPLRAEIERLAGRARIALGGDEGETPADAVAELGLTAREQDVLRLVTAGRSNRQIAEELFISPKTASVHVSNMMAKLGVAGRGEAAAVAHKLRLFEQTEPV
ncbi:helix-turn-helix transcriptional regulator [Streptomyces boninensis]|uniref:helix-turn-helix transcriptional regulator n=1 Tax=Streptomyces boninensis TaxID=2039455 RepID=UPI003B220719